MYTIARLSEDQLATVRQLEQEEGVRVVAVTDLSLHAAKLSDDKLAHLRALEEKLGVCLVAVE